MGIYIPDMEMPKTGAYVVGVDNTNGRDVTVITVFKEKERGSGTFYPVGTYELVNVPPHGRLIDAEKLGLSDFDIVRCEGNFKEGLIMLLKKIDEAPTVIPAEEA